MRISEQFAKGVLSSHHFFTIVRGKRVFGKRIAFDRDSRGLGAVVVYPGGRRGFFGVNPHTGKVESWGEPPPRRKR